MKFLKKNPKRLIYIPVILICVIGISLFLVNCSLYTKTDDESVDKLYPSFSNSNIKLIDLNGGDTYSLK